MIKLIINADDFGYSKVFNETILELLERGRIKSTTAMMNWGIETQEKQVRELINLKNKNKIGIGLHLEFELKKPINEQIKTQYNKFISVFSFVPSHLDIHKISGNKELIKEVDEFAFKNNLPFRNQIKNIKSKTTDYPIFSIMGKELKEILKFIQNLKERKSCEIMTHPGKYDADSKSLYNREREFDYETIIKINEFLKNHKNIKLSSYLDL